MRSLCSALTLALAVGFAAAPATAGLLCPPHTLCFDEELSGTAASLYDFGPVSVTGGLVISEADAQFLTGFDTSGWATSGDQGLLNTLDPSITFQFDHGVTSFGASVRELPDAPYQIFANAYAGDTLVGGVFSDPNADFDTLLLEGLGAFDRVEIGSAVVCILGIPTGCPMTTTLFVDSVSYAPEPGVAALLAFGVLTSALRRRA